MEHGIKCDKLDWEISGNVAGPLALTPTPCGRPAIHFYMSRANNNQLYRRCEEHFHDDLESIVNFINLSVEEFCCREIMTS